MKKSAKQKKFQISPETRLTVSYIAIATVLVGIAVALMLHGTPEQRLWQAVQQCNVRLAQDAITSGAPANSRSAPNAALPQVPALFWAARNGCFEIVTLLLANKAEVNATVTGPVYTGWTALLIAAEKGYAPIVQSLLAAGANVNAAGKDGKTALQLAEAGSQAEIARLLKAAGAK